MSGVEANKFQDFPDSVRNCAKKEKAYFRVFLFKHDKRLKLLDSQRLTIGTDFFVRNDSRFVGIGVRDFRVGTANSNENFSNQAVRVCFSSHDE